MEPAPLSTPTAQGTVTVVGSYIVALVMDVDRIPLEGETKKYYETMLNLTEVKEWAQAAVKEPWVIEHH